MTASYRQMDVGYSNMAVTSGVDSPTTPSVRECLLPVGSDNPDTMPGQQELVLVPQACVVDPSECKADIMRQLYTEDRPPTTPTDQQPLEIIEQQREPLSKWRVFMLNVSWYGISLMFLVLSVEVVPAQIQAMVGSASKGRWLGGMVAGGAVIMFMAGPLVGMRSDRLVSKYGKRRPVMVTGLIMVCGGLCGMAFTAPQIRIKRNLNATGDCIVDLVAQRCRPYWNHSGPIPLNVHQEEKGSLPQQGVVMPEKDQHVDSLGEELTGNIGLYIVFFLMVNASFVVMTVPYNALIADKSHPQQRGLSSGVMGFMILFGNISGAALGLFFVQMGVFGIYGCVVTVMVISVMSTVLATPEAPAKPTHEPLEWKSVITGFWEPLKEPDFRWVFITRFLMQQGVSTVTGFLEYWLQDMIELPFCWSPERSVAMMLVPLLGTAALGSIVCGILSDKIGRRKPLVIVSAMMMFVVTLILAFIRGQHAYYVAISLAFVFGSGFGSYQAVDFALVMDVLPEEKDKAKDIAVWHQALILPQALATPIGGVLLDIFESLNCELGLGYIILFLMTALYFLASGSFVLKIKGVR